MGILQGLLVYLRKSAGKVVQAIFGWAVRALFGSVAESEKTLLSLVVVAAGAWPLLLVGVPFPKAAALVLAFVPIPKWVQPEWIRAAWIVAAALVPIGVGIVLARRGNPDRVSSRWKTALQGFPVTVGLSAAFLTAFITSPIRRLVALAKRREDLTIPHLVSRDQYEAAAERIRVVLEKTGFRVRRQEPPWLLTAPSRVLRALGGGLLRDQIPEHVLFYRGPELDVVVNVNDVTLQGEKEAAARAHGRISEEATLGPALQTVDAEAQKLEKDLKDVWSVFARNPDSHAGSAALRGAIDSLAARLEKTILPFEDWQVLYREILQVSRAIDGDTQLLANGREEPMAEDKRRPGGGDSRPDRVASLSTAQLIAGLTGELRELVRTEVALAKTELRVDLKHELRSAKWLGIAAVASVCFLNMLFVAAAFLLARWMSPPVGALVVAGILLAIAAVAAVAGKAAFVKPMETTRKTLAEDWRWAKNRIA